MEKLRIGTRGSALALKQAQLVKEALETITKAEIEIVIIKTQGDKILDKPLIDFGGKGVFVTEFEDAILEGRIDLAVHSAKDMPMELADGLCIGACLEREDVSDMLLLSDAAKEKHQRGEAITVGTGSYRRQCQLKKRYPHIEFQSIRGNLPTRMEKIKTGAYDGIVLAYAGLKRIHLLEEDGIYYEKLSIDTVLPAAGQGIIAIECMEHSKCHEIVAKLNSEKTMFALETERTVLKGLEAGCNEAIGAYAKVEHGKVFLDIFRYEEDELRRASGEAFIGDRQDLAMQLVDKIKNGR